MTFDSAKVPEHLIQAAQKGTLVPLVGAGVSRQTGHPFPTWRELIQILNDYALTKRYVSKEENREIRRLQEQGLSSMATEALRTRFPIHEYLKVIEAQFDTGLFNKPAAIHKALLRLRPQLILTTNYDRTLEHANAQEFGEPPQEFREPPNVYTYLEASVVPQFFKSGYDRDLPLIFKIYGSITDPEEMIFTDLDFWKASSRHPGALQMLSNIFSTHTILIIGLSILDQELTLLLESLRGTLKYSFNSHYIFLPANEVGSILRSRLKTDFGIEVIAFTPSREKQELLEFVNFLGSKIPPRSVSPGLGANEKKKRGGKPASRVKTLRIVVASPSDVQPERKAVSTVVDELNGGLAKKLKLKLELYKWETEAYPGFHPDGPQGLIDHRLGIENCDILIGIFWKRFGTPTKHARSGTAHEFNTAVRAWERNGRPEIMFYFNQKASTPKSREEAEQWSKVLEFREKYPKTGLSWSFDGTTDFKEMLRKHLTRVIEDSQASRSLGAAEIYQPGRSG